AQAGNQAGNQAGDQHRAVPAQSDRRWRPSRAAPRKQLTQQLNQRASLKQATAPKVGTDDLEVRYVTTKLNVRTDPADGADVLTVLAEGSKVKASGRTDDEWAEILHDGEYRWVHAEYLSTDKPETDTESSGDGGSDNDSSNGSDGGSDAGDSSGGGSGDGISAAACPSGSSAEDGLTSNAIKVHRAVCAKFPQIDSYGGMRTGDSGEHGQGRALDIMISDSSTGDSVAEWVRANAGELGVSEVIWSQRIWTVQRSSEGWRSMPDRGSATANHYDHVHVTVY